MIDEEEKGEGVSDAASSAGSEEAAEHARVMAIVEDIMNRFSRTLDILAKS